MLKNNSLRRWLIALSWALASTLPSQVISANEIHIPAGDLAVALELFTKQSGAEIVYEADKVKGVHTKGVDGDLPKEQAVKKLLEGTHFVVYMDPSGAMLISSVTSQQAANSSRNPPGVAAASNPMGTVLNEESMAAMEAITVTARKRQEPLFDVPIVAVVVGTQALSQSEIRDLATLATDVPGLVVSGGPSVTGPSVSIRGVGTTVINATSDQSVSLNVDGLQLSQSFAYNAALFDLSQVEVLKGPQALFFGKNSPAGVISLHSADPTDQVEEIVRGGYEAVAQGKLGELILSGPVTDTLKLRLAAHYLDDNGFFKNLDTAPEGFGVRSPTTNHFTTDQNVVLARYRIVQSIGPLRCPAKSELRLRLFEYGAEGQPDRLLPARGGGADEFYRAPGV